MNSTTQKNVINENTSLLHLPLKMLSDSFVFYDKCDSFGLLLMVFFLLLNSAYQDFFNDIYGVIIETSMYYGYFFFISLTYLIFFFLEIAIVNINNL
jgi:hypothetical protein